MRHLPIVDGHDVLDDFFGGHLALFQMTEQGGHEPFHTPAVLFLASVDVDQKTLQVVARLVEMALVFLVVKDGVDHASILNGFLPAAAGFLLGSHDENE